MARATRVHFMRTSHGMAGDAKLVAAADAGCGADVSSAGGAGTGSTVAERRRRRGGCAVDPDGYFISYTAQDRAWAEWIATELQLVGVTTILQEWDFRPGDNFVTKMHQGLSDMGSVLAVLSRRYLDSRFAEIEWTAAIAQPTSRLLPVRIDDIEPVGLLASIVYVDLHGCDQSTARQRLRAAVLARSVPASAVPFPGPRAPFPTPSPREAPRLRSGRPQLVARLTATVRTTGRPLLVSGLPSTHPASALIDAVRCAFPQSEPIVIRPRPSVLPATALLDALRAAVVGEPVPTVEVDESIESCAASTIRLVAERLSPGQVVVVVNVDEMAREDLAALVEGFSGRMLGLALETTGDPLASLEVGRFVVPPMDKAEAAGYLSDSARDLFGRDVDPRVLDGLPASAWALPSVLDALLPMLAELTDDFASWYGSHPSVRTAEQRIADFLAALEPIEVSMLVAVVLSDGSDVRAAIEAVTDVPTDEALAVLLQLLRRGLVVRDGDRYVVPGLISGQLEVRAIERDSTKLAMRLLEQPTLAPRDVELTSHAVSVAHRSYAVRPDPHLARPDVLDAINGVGHWATYLLIIDAALEVGDLDASEQNELRLRRVRKHIQLGRFADADRDLGIVSEGSVGSTVAELDVESHRLLLLFGTGRNEEARTVGTRLEHVARELGDHHRLAKILNVLGNVLLVEGRLSEALGAYDRGFAAATRAGDAIVAIDSRIGRVRAAIRLGSSPDLAGDLDELARRCELEGRRTQRGQVEYLRAVLHECDDPEYAETHARLARSFSDPSSATYGLADGLLWRLQRFAEVSGTEDGS